MCCHDGCEAKPTVPWESIHTPWPVQPRIKSKFQVLPEIFWFRTGLWLDHSNTMLWSKPHCCRTGWTFRVVVLRESEPMSQFQLCCNVWHPPPKNCLVLCLFIFTSALTSFPCPCWRTASTQPAAAITMFQSEDGVFRVMCNVRFPPFSVLQLDQKADFWSDLHRAFSTVCCDPYMACGKLQTGCFMYRYFLQQWLLSCNSSIKVQFLESITNICPVDRFRHLTVDLCCYFFLATFRIIAVLAWPVSLGGWLKFEDLPFWTRLANKDPKA